MKKLYQGQKKVCQRFNKKKIVKDLKLAYEKDLKFFEETNKKNFRLKYNYTSEKEFSLALKKWDGSPAKFFSKEIRIEFLIKPRQNRRKKCMTT